VAADDTVPLARAVGVLHSRPMLAVRNLAKRFGDVPALQDVTFEVGRGEIVGFLGPNGAGKTTTLRILSTYLTPDSGTASIAGHDTAREPMAVRRQLGYLPEHPPLYLDHTVLEYLRFCAALRGVPRGRRAVAVAVDGRVVVEVRDTGSGMSPEAVARLFTPFFTTKPPGRGTGLGLAICHRIVTSLGGEITVESAPGAGSTLRVHLPPARPSESGAAHGPSAATASPRRGRILVVDDEPLILSAIRRSLGTEHEVVTATQAVQALDRITAGERFDVVLCDLLMPNMTGMDLHARLVSAAPDQAEKMIFLTGGAFALRARTFLEQSRNLWIEKPFDPAALRNLINARLRG